MSRPPCCCPLPDASHCYSSRYGISVLDLDPDERCECSCHSKDWDGRDAWDEEDPDYWLELDATP